MKLKIGSEVVFNGGGRTERFKKGAVLTVKKRVPGTDRYRVSNARGVSTYITAKHLEPKARRRKRG